MDLSSIDRYFSHLKGLFSIQEVNLKFSDVSNAIPNFDRYCSLIFYLEVLSVSEFAKYYHRR